MKWKTGILWFGFILSQMGTVKGAHADWTATVTAVRCDSSPWHLYDLWDFSTRTPRLPGGFPATESEVIQLIRAQLPELATKIEKDRLKWISVPGSYELGASSASAPTGCESKFVTRMFAAGTTNKIYRDEVLLAALPPEERILVNGRLGMESEVGKGTWDEKAVLFRSALAPFPETDTLQAWIDLQNKLGLFPEWQGLPIDVMQAPTYHGPASFDFPNRDGPASILDDIYFPVIYGSSVFCAEPEPIHYLKADFLRSCDATIRAPLPPTVSQPRRYGFFPSVLVNGIFELTRGADGKFWSVGSPDGTVSLQASLPWSTQRAWEASNVKVDRADFAKGGGRFFFNQPLRILDSDVSIESPRRFQYFAMWDGDALEMGIPQGSEGDTAVRLGSDSIGVHSFNYKRSNKTTADLFLSDGPVGDLTKFFAPDLLIGGTGAFRSAHLIRKDGRWRMNAAQGESTILVPGSSWLPSYSGRWSWGSISGETWLDLFDEVRSDRAMPSWDGVFSSSGGEPFLNQLRANDCAKGWVEPKPLLNVKIFGRTFPVTIFQWELCDPHSSAGELAGTLRVRPKMRELKIAGQRVFSNSDIDLVIHLNGSTNQLLARVALKNPFRAKCRDGRNVRLAPGDDAEFAYTETNGWSLETPLAGCVLSGP